MLSLIRKAIYYTFSIGSEALIAAALLPILTSRLAPTDYGLWVLLIASVSFFRPLLQLMIPDTLKMKFFQYKTPEILGIVSIAVILPCSLSAIILLVNYLSGDFFSALINFNNQELALILLFAILHGFYYLILALLQFREKPKLFLAQQIFQTVVTISFTLIFLKFETSWRAPLIARIIALSLNSILGLLWIKSIYGGFWSLQNILPLAKDVIFTGLKLLPAGLAIVIVPLTDRLIVSKMISPQETSFLGIGALFSLVISIFVAGLIHAWQPILYKQINNIESKENISLYSKLYFFIIPLFGAILAFIGIKIAPFMTSYDVSLINPYIIIFSIVAVMDGFYQHFYIILKGLQKTNLLSLFSSLLIVSNIIIDLVLVRYLGGVGVAWGTVFAYAIVTILATIFVLRIKKIH